MIDQPEDVAQHLKTQLQQVREQRKTSSDAYYFNWQLTIPAVLQHPFEPNHDNMAALTLHSELPTYQLASQLRQVFSGIVAGNVKAQGIRAITEHGPYLLSGNAGIMHAMDDFLTMLVTQKRMKLGDKPYHPCYRIITIAKR
jgi:hypothetical protein